MQSTLLYRCNPLAYPAGTAPGFDPNHVAAHGALFSAISTGSNFRNLIPGLGGSTVKGTVNSTITPGIHGAVGPITGGFATGNVSFPGLSITADRYVTFAAIITIAGSVNVGVFGLSTAGAPPALCTFVASRLFFSCGAGDFDSGISLTASPTYFIAASYDNTTGVINFVAAPLNGAGVPITSTVAGVAGAVGVFSGWTLGKEQRYGTNFTNDIAAVMHSRNYLSIPQLLQWASDPWAFWYPRQKQMLIATSSVIQPVTTVLYQLMNVG